MVRVPSATDDRDPYIDNAKFLLMILVVFGHLIHGIPEAFRAYYAIYIFHMPAFIFLSGAVSKSHLSRHSFLKLLSAYIIFNVLYFALLANKINPAHLTILRPLWITWFLLSLIYWRASLAFFIDSKFPVIVGVTLSLLSVFYFPLENTLSLLPAASFLPFFLAGYFHKDFIDQAKAATFGKRTLLCLTFVLTLLFGSQISAQLVPHLPQGPLSAPSIRAHLLLISFVSTLSFLYLVPRKKGFFTEMGQRTMTPFLLHGCFVYFLKDEIQRLSSFSLPLMFIVVLFLSIAITLLLSTKPVDSAVTSAINSFAQLLDKMIPGFKKK